MSGLNPAIAASLERVRGRVPAGAALCLIKPSVPAPRWDDDPRNEHYCDCAPCRAAIRAVTLTTAAECRAAHAAVIAACAAAPPPPLATPQWWAQRWLDNASPEERDAMRDLLK